MVNGFQKVRAEASSFPVYILDDALDNDTPNDDNGINDNDDDDENYINDNNGNNDRNHHNGHHYDDNDNNYDNDNGDQTIMILQTMHFGEPFICEKAEFFESAQILMCLPSVNPCLIYREELRFLKNHRHGSPRSLCKIVGGGNLYRVGAGRVSTAFH